MSKRNLVALRKISGFVSGYRFSDTVKSSKIGGPFRGWDLSSPVDTPSAPAFSPRKAHTAKPRWQRRRVQSRSSAEAGTERSPTAGPWQGRPETAAGKFLPAYGNRNRLPTANKTAAGFQSRPSPVRRSRSGERPNPAESGWPPDPHR